MTQAGRWRRRARTVRLYALSLLTCHRKWLGWREWLPEDFFVQYCAADVRRWQYDAMTRTHQFFRLRQEIRVLQDQLERMGETNRRLRLRVVGVLEGDGDGNGG